MREPSAKVPVLKDTDCLLNLHVNAHPSGKNMLILRAKYHLPCRRSADRLASSDYPERWKPRKEPRPPNRSSVRPFVRIFSHGSSNTRERHAQVCSNFRVNPHQGRGVSSPRSANIAARLSVNGKSYWSVRRSECKS